MVEILKQQGLEYTGNVQPQLGEYDEKTGSTLYPYLPSSQLVEAVQPRCLLRKTSFDQGEPGCGKTRLAYAVAYELGLPIETWYVKSTSIARDGLYVFDTVGRLRDAQLAAVGRLSEQKISIIDEPETYIRYGALGEAFRSTTRMVVLIDEIDKADIDFPNDLLIELDERSLRWTKQVCRHRPMYHPLLLSQATMRKSFRAHFYADVSFTT